MKVFDVLLVSVSEIVLVPGVTVRPVVVPVSQTVPVPLRVQVPDPIEMVLVLVLEEEKAGVLTENVLAASVPWVIVRVLVAVSAAPKVTVLPEPLMVSA